MGWILFSFFCSLPVLPGERPALGVQEPKARRRLYWPSTSSVSSGHRAASGRPRARMSPRRTHPVRSTTGARAQQVATGAHVQINWTRSHFPYISGFDYCFSCLAHQHIFLLFFFFPFGTEGAWEIIWTGDCFHNYMDIGELKKIFSYIILTI